MSSEESVVKEEEFPTEIDGIPVPKPLQGFVKRLDETHLLLRRGLVPNMKSDGIVIVDKPLLSMLFEEISEKNVSGFIPSIMQVANVASTPGIVGPSLAMPDIHSAYGFSIGGVMAVDMDAPGACVCPGGVGYDINCGVCLLRTNLQDKCLEKPKARERLADLIFSTIPVGVGSLGGIDLKNKLDEVLAEGLPWLVENGLARPEDVEFCESRGHIEGGNPKKVTDRAKSRGKQQLGTLGSGNHYIEVQRVAEVYDQKAADVMGIGKIGQICVMIHSGSRGLGHQICADTLKAIAKSPALVPNSNDHQLDGLLLDSDAARDYLSAMACGANFAFCNRGTMRYRIRNAFGAAFECDPAELDLGLVYDVCHNLAKIEEHTVDGRTVRCLVHRKGATRAFPPGHETLPDKYKEIGQPVIIGGSMGTCSYILTGTEHGMETTFGSTCHGAGRALSRAGAKKAIGKDEVFKKLGDMGVVLKIANPALVAEEAAEAYKDVTEVVSTCADAGISKLVVRLEPLIVCKG